MAVDRQKYEDKNQYGFGSHYYFNSQHIAPVIKRSNQAA